MHQQQDHSDLRHMVRSLNNYNHLVQVRADRIVYRICEVLFCVLLGVAGTLLLLAWLEPCEAGSLCMSALITRPRTGPRQWLHSARHWLYRRSQALRAAYLRSRIDGATKDLHHLQDAADHIPLQQELHRHCIEAWRVQLIDCDLNARKR